MALDLSTPPVITDDSRRSRVEHVVAIVSEWIIQRRLEPGEMLPAEARLAEHFSVSRTVIREAARLLAERGLIEVMHGKRHRVRPPSGEIAANHLRRMVTRGYGSLDDLVEVRLPLEKAIAALAAQRRSEEQIRTARQCVADQTAAESLEAQVQQDVRFHEMLAEMTGNPMFTLMLHAVAGPLAESRRKTIGRPGGNVKSIRGHVEILEALEAGDAARAEDAMHKHLKTASDDLRRLGAAGE